MAKSPRDHGNIIAFEGPAELVSAQLRLLPTSPQIMILPNLQHYLLGDSNQQPFSVRHLIYQIHKASKTRHAAALEFLRPSRADKKRIIFLDGGTVGAHSLCLSAISKHYTNGDVEKAGSIFNKLASNGVAGLVRGRPTTLSSANDASPQLEKEPRSSKDPDTQATGTRGSSGKKRKSVEEALLESEHDEVDDPIIRAMRAADALYLETECLQPPNHDVDLTSRSTSSSRTRSRRSLSLSALHFAEFLQSSRSSSRSRLTQSYPLTTADNCLAAILQVSATVRPLRTKIPLNSLSWVDEASDVGSSMVSPSSESHSSRPQTPDRLTRREIRVTGVRLLPKQKRTRSKSLERSFLDSEDERSLADLILQLPAERTSRSGSRGGKYQTSCRSSVATTKSGSQPKSTDSNSPDAGAEKAPTTPSNRTSSQPSGEPRSPDTSSDKLVDATDIVHEVLPNAGLSAQQQQQQQQRLFEPVLPLLEDLVVHFSGEAPDELFEMVLQGFRNGANASRTSAMETPGSGGGLGDSESTLKAPNDTAAHRNTILSIETPSELSSYYGVTPPIQTDFIQAAPTLDQRFYNLSVGSQAAVAVQNSLRLVLKSRFPLDNWAYCPSQFSAHMEKESLWKPVFLDAVPRAASKSNRKTDLILAIGAEMGVKREYISTVMGQIEKLGAKTTGLSRTGRLDLRYLIANAMQAFTSQPLTRQARENPFTDSTLLAALIVPHLETYLTLHANVCFLIIEYPVEHLATVLALQKLIGVEMFKVACILNGENPETHDRPLSAPPGLEHERYAAAAGAGALSLPQSPNPESFSGARLFSKANYLLTYLATGSETSGFVAAIRETLASISNYYVPEVPPRKGSLLHNSYMLTDVDLAAKVSKAVRLQTPPPPLHPKTSLSSGILDTPPSSPLEYFSTGKPRSATRPLSPTLSTKSRASLKTPVARGGGSGEEADGSRHVRTPSDSPKDHRLRLVKVNSAPNNYYSRYDGLVADDEDEGDSDAEERRLMPLFLRRQAERGNSQKAMKWLGLE
ncbi:hypothetical protein B0H63DRAFT_151075 [Podospora didyma]|uniref:Gastric mucin n=1 Tax=Podospora didyma TaxID=330526 RepID=A0AAE0NT10_9PEZI|nr:hypothetical protein B0H63DRAFT_151075 [Podospora didyma]